MLSEPLRDARQSLGKPCRAWSRSFSVVSAIVVTFLAGMAIRPWRGDRQEPVKVTMTQSSRLKFQMLTIAPLGEIRFKDPIGSREFWEYRRARANGESIESLRIARDQRILDALQVKVQMELIDVELGQALEYVSDRYQIALILDPNAIERVAVAEDRLVSFDVSDVTLESALGQLLDPLGLGFEVRDGILMVTVVAETFE